MLNAKDLELLAAKGIGEKQIEEQLACFVKGFPFLEITASASVEKGIMVIPQEKQATYMDAWDAYLAKNKKIVKFVPASGAASRMFKNLYEFLSADYNEPQNAFEKKFFDDIRKFAFYDALNQACIENELWTTPERSVAFSFLSADSPRGYGRAFGRRCDVCEEQCRRSEYTFHCVT